MQICLLHLDDALESQPGFIRACEQAGARHIRLPEQASAVRLWGHHEALQSLHDNICNETRNWSGPMLTFMGSGDFHHITSSLLAIALQDVREPVTLIHFDNHPDWVHFNKGTHCGSWVNKAIALPQIVKTITIGVCSNDLRMPEWKGANLDLLSKGLLELYPYAHASSAVRKDYGTSPSYCQGKGVLHWNTIKKMGEQNFITHLLSRITTKAIYITIDKDVLAREDAVTNWDQGQMRLPYLLTLLRELSRKHRIIAADVTGDYSPPSYTGSPLTRFLKHAEIYLDQPHSKPDIAQATNINSAANHALLETLAEAMA